MATFEGNPTTTVIVAYSPTNTTGSEEKVELFYQELREATKATPKHNMLITLEDFNAHIDKNSAQHSLQEQSTRNSEYLFEFAEEQELTICNSNFRKKAGKQWAFIDPSGRLYLKDYILINNKWRNSVKNAEPYSSFSSVGSNHHDRVSHDQLEPKIKKKGKNYGSVILVSCSVKNQKKQKLL